MQSNLQANLAELNQAFDGCSDVVTHHLQLQDGTIAAVLFVDGLVNQDFLDRDVLQPLLTTSSLPPMAKIPRTVTRVPETALIDTLDKAISRILAGETVLLVDGFAEGLAFGLQGWESRSIEEPQTEATIRGPRDGFVETLRFNTALLRRRIRTPKFKLKPLQIGKLTRTDVAIAYIEGVADPAVVAEVQRRLGRIELDAVLESGYLEEMMEDSPLSPFPQVQQTERPDTAAAQLLEGRVVILTDGTPFALAVPVVWAQFMQSPEDYYERFMISTALRMVRYIFMVVALLLPSLYVAIITFHPEMIPTALLLSVASSREGVPFPALVEALLMEVAFEALREAGIRLPRPVGQAVSIVGALVIGEAAVRAGIVSAPKVIIVAITGISSFAIPRYNAAIAVRMLRFVLLLGAGTMGLFGVAAIMSGILLHLCSLRSFGVPYMTPIAPLNWQGLKDVVLRAPRWWMRFRPKGIAGANRVRVEPGQRPRPHRTTRGGT